MREICIPPRTLRETCITSLRSAVDSRRSAVIGHLSFILLFSLFTSLSAQNELPVNHELWEEKDRLIQMNEIPVFTALKPIPDILYFARIHKDTTLNSPPVVKQRAWIYRKLFMEDLIKIHSQELNFRLNPLLSFDLAHDNNLNSLVYRNTRGIRLDGNAGQILSFTSSFYENQATFPQYVSQKIATSLVIPGQGYYKTLGKNGYDFAWAEGNLSILAAKNLILEIGYGKRFFGEGYRSLLLSDYSFVYPYAGYWWTYGNWFISAEVHSYVQSLTPVTFDSDRFPAKTATLHFIGYKWDHFQLALMESNMYANPDSLGKFHWQAEFLNPIPFVNSIANRGNNMFGLNMKLYVSHSFQLYAQLAIDELDWNRLSVWSSIKNKNGIQIGGKYFNPFNIENLYFQFEYNQVRPYMYSSENPAEAYTHYNEPLAHPLGANFKEIITIANYRKARWFFDAHFAYSLSGLDNNNSNWGSDIFLSDRSAQLGYPSDGNYIAQGVRSQLLNSDLKISYILNPKNTLNFSVGYQHRSQSSSLSRNITDFIYLSLRTSLNNLYYDF